MLGADQNGARRKNETMRNHLSAGREIPIRADTNVEEVIDCCARVANVFIQRRMHCVGCSMARFETVADVCAIYRQPLDAVLEDLREALAGCDH